MQSHEPFFWSEGFSLGAHDPDSDSHYPGREPLAKSPHEPSVMEKGLRATATRQE